MIELDSRCEFYKSKYYQCMNREKSSTLFTPNANERVIEWCTHQDSLYRKHNVGINLKCHGDINKWSICPRNHTEEEAA
jgi:hypothetical protein